jgi:exocyst complex component 4
MTDDSTHNPETDTFQYIRLVIEALNKMSRLDMAVDTIEQRLPVELFKVVDKSNNEVAQRHPSILRAYTAKIKGKTKTEVENEDIRTTLLNDLMWTLYARFEAIAEGHRVVHDVVAGIVRRENRAASSATLTRGFKELWKLYQSEVGDPQSCTCCLTNELLDAVASSRLSCDRWRSFLQGRSRPGIYWERLFACTSGQKQAHV